MPMSDQQLIIIGLAALVVILIVIVVTLMLRSPESRERRRKRKEERELRRQKDNEEFRKNAEEVLKSLGKQTTDETGRPLSDEELAHKGLEVALNFFRDPESIKKSIAKKELLIKEAELNKTLVQVTGKNEGNLQGTVDQIMALQKEMEEMLAKASDETIKQQIRAMYEAKMRTLGRKAG